MQYVRLGKSGLKISKIILGCMSYGDPEWHEWVLREKEGIEHIKYAYAHGINTFDTADIYSCGASEEILGKAIREIGCPREDVVILTKLYMPITHGSRAAPPAFPDLDKSGYTNQYGLSRKHIFAAVQASLKRLNVEYIDVLQCHRFDYNTPIEETMQALHDVVQKGWVRYIGMSRSVFRLNQWLHDNCSGIVVGHTNSMPCRITLSTTVLPHSSPCKTSTTPLIVRKNAR